MASFKPSLYMSLFSLVCPSGCKAESSGVIPLTNEAANGLCNMSTRLVFCYFGACARGCACSVRIVSG